MKNIEINSKALKKLAMATLISMSLGLTGCGNSNENEKPKDEPTNEVNKKEDDKLTQEEVDAMAESLYGFENVKVIDFETSNDEYKNGQEIKEVLDAVELEKKGFAVEYYGIMTITSADGEIVESSYFDYVQPEEDVIEATHPNGATSIRRFDYSKVYKIVGLAESDHGIVKVIEVDGNLKSCGNVLTEELENMYSSKTLTK